MAVNVNYESNAKYSEELKNSSELNLDDFSENVSKLLDNYDIEVLSDHLEHCIKKISNLKKRNKKLIDDLELMTKCFLEMLEKNDMLEEALKNLKKEASI